MFKNRLAAAAIGLMTVAVGLSAAPSLSYAATLPQAPYTVQGGDSIYSVAVQAGFGLSALERVNHLQAPYAIFPGQHLALPFLYRVDTGDRLSYLARRYDTTVADIRRLNHLDQNTPLRTGRVLLIARGSVQASDYSRQLPSQLGASLRMSTSAPALAVTATAYDGSAASNGPWGAVDYFGDPLVFGDVAVDPAVIPLGSKLFISGYSDSSLPQKGFYGTAVDVGGAIKGNRIDIYLPTTARAIKFGIESVRVQIVKS